MCPTDGLLSTEAHDASVLHGELDASERLAVERVARDGDRWKGIETILAEKRAIRSTKCGRVWTMPRPTVRR